MNCPKCGENIGAYKYCPFCGATIIEQNSSFESVTPPSDQPAVVIGKQTKKRRFSPVVITLCCILVVGIVFGALMVLKNIPIRPDNLIDTGNSASEIKPIVYLSESGLKPIKDKYDEKLKYYVTHTFTDLFYEGSEIVKEDGHAKIKLNFRNPFIEEVSISAAESNSQFLSAYINMNEEGAELNLPHTLDCLFGLYNEDPTNMIEEIKANGLDQSYRFEDNGILYDYYPSYDGASTKITIFTGEFTERNAQANKKRFDDIMKNSINTTIGKLRSAPVNRDVYYHIKGELKNITEDDGNYTAYVNDEAGDFIEVHIPKKLYDENEEYTDFYGMYSHVPEYYEYLFVYCME